MMMVLCPKAGSLALTPPGDEMSEVVSRCLPLRQLWASNLSKVATQGLEVDANPRTSGCKEQNIPLHHLVPLITIPTGYYHLWSSPPNCRLQVWEAAMEEERQSG